MVQLSQPYMSTGKTTALTIWAFVSKVISLLFNMLSRLVLAYFLVITIITGTKGFLGGSEVKASASNAGDSGSIPGLGRSPGEGNGNPL